MPVELTKSAKKKLPAAKAAKAKRNAAGGAGSIKSAKKKRRSALDMAKKANRR